MAEEKLKYKTLIIAVSVIVPLLVALLFGIRVPNVAPLTILPPIYAAINGITAVLLLFAYWAIRNQKRALHETLMKTSIILSLLFLAMYVAYHMTSDSTLMAGKDSFGMSISSF